MLKEYDEIFKISLIKPNSVVKLESNNLDGYMLKNNDEYAVAIPFDYSIDIHEEFVGMALSTNYLNFDNQSIKVLYLHASINVDLDKFCYVASEFTEIKNREKIIANPRNWVDDWKNIFGDSIKNKRIYDTIGELLALKYLFSIDKSAKWMGPSSGTHDIVLDKKVVEVKSSIKKSETVVEINSRFQLQDDKKEELFFCRLEAKPYAYSINSLVNDLVNDGYPQDELEKSLFDLGYKKGSRERTITFDLLEMLSFDVNNQNFPIIKLEELNSFAPKKNILNYTLKLDLSSLDNKKLL